MTIRRQPTTRVKLRDKQGRFIKITSVSLQKRDKYGRFVQVNRLGVPKRNPPRLRDGNGRFVASPQQRRIYRDKHGRFAKAQLPWHKRRYATLIPIILGISGAIYFGYQINKPIIIEDPVAASPSQVTQPTPDISKVTVVMPKSEPTRIRIAKIAVNAPFTTLGKKTDGTIEVPRDPYVVGWYTKAPTPGELGPAIVIGHVDRPGGQAVFWRLRELVPGDIVEVDRADGTTVRFRVDGVKQVPQDSFPTEEVYGNISYAGVRLITCGGTFNRDIRQYSHNTVVYGSLVI